MATLKTHELTKSYGGRTVVKGVSLDVTSGEIVGLLGPNGAGKTTTFYMTVGLTAPDSGRVTLDGEDVTDDPMYCARAGASATCRRSPRSSAASRSSRTCSRSSRRCRCRAPSAVQRARELLAELGLTTVAASPAYTLSGGERRRAEITRALVMSPKFILLDEPFAGIDPIAVTDIQKIIHHLKERGIGVLITDHNVRETLQNHRPRVHRDGRQHLSRGTPASLAGDEEVRRIYLGTDFRLD